MKRFHKIISIIVVMLSFTTFALAQKNRPLGENAALRYWAAFSAIQDAGITDAQEKELNAFLDGTAPFDDLKYKDLLEKNTLALEIMARGTSIPDCDWGIDYGLGDNIPVENVRKALVLGRLNVLYAFHLFKTDKKDEGVDALTAGLKFSHDVANGGSFFAVLIAKDLLAKHLQAVAGVLHLEQLSASQRSRLQQAIAQLSRGLDWTSAAKWEMEALKIHFAGDAQASSALPRVASSYVAALNDPSKLPALNDAIASAPQELANLIPNAKRVLEQKEDLNNTLKQTQMLLR